MSLTFWNRYTSKVEEEQVYGDGLMKLLYGSAVSRSLTDTLLTGPLVSKLVGRYQDSFLSLPNIRSFVHQYSIPMDEYELARYSSFNDFFIRRFRAGARPFVAAAEKMPAFAEGRYVGFASTSPAARYPVKGKFLSVAFLLGSQGNSYIERLNGGPCLIARLCPVDYHRFHFPDSGKCIDQFQVNGKLHSVNPLALECKADIFITNERQVSILETKNFGLLAYIEVGALCVGRIKQTHPTDEPFSRGEEKGYFQFGGSTVIVLGEAGAWSPTKDILENTGNRIETFVKLGDEVAHKTLQLQEKERPSNA